MPLRGFENAHVGQPIAHHGQQLVGVADVGGDEQRSVGVGVLLLLGQQGAALEVMGHLGCNTQQHLGGALGEPHVVFVVDVGVVGGVGGEAAGGVDLQGHHQGHAEILELPAFNRRQVPHAVSVDQPVGLCMARLVFVGELADVPLFDGRLQQGKVRALFAQVFLGGGLHLGGAVGCGRLQLGEQVAQAGVGEQVLCAGQPGVVVQAPGGDGASGRLGELPASVRFVPAAFGDATQSLTQVALDGAHIDLKVAGQLALVDVVALVEQREDVREALGQFFSFGTAGGVARWIVHGAVRGRVGQPTQAAWAGGLIGFTVFFVMKRKNRPDVFCRADTAPTRQTAKIHEGKYYPTATVVKAVGLKWFFVTELHGGDCGEPLRQVVSFWRVRGFFSVSVPRTHLAAPV